MLGSSVDRELHPSFLWKNCHKKYNCWDKKNYFYNRPHLLSEKFQKFIYLYFILQWQKSESCTPRKMEIAWDTRGKKEIRQSPRSVICRRKNVPQWNQIWFSDSYLLFQNPAEVMEDNKSCKSAKDEHSNHVFDFFSSMNFDAIRDYVFFVFLFLIFFIAGTVPLTVKEEEEMFNI